MSQQKCTATLVWEYCTSQRSLVLCKTGSQQACVIAMRLMEICCLHMCAVSQQICFATLVWEKCTSHCSVLLCKTGSQHARITAITSMEIDPRKQPRAEENSCLLATETTSGKSTSPSKEHTNEEYHNSRHMCRLVTFERRKPNEAMQPSSSPSQAE